MKRQILICILAVSSATAQDKPSPAPQAHELTDAEQKAIWRRLFEQSQANTAKRQADAALQEALNVCGHGQAVATNDKTGDLICVSAPEKPTEVKK